MPSRVTDNIATVQFNLSPNAFVSQLDLLRLATPQRNATQHKHEHIHSAPLLFPTHITYQLECKCIFIFVTLYILYCIVLQIFVCAYMCCTYSMCMCIQVAARGGSLLLSVPLERWRAAPHKDGARGVAGALSCAFLSYSTYMNMYSTLYIVQYITVHCCAAHSITCRERAFTHSTHSTPLHSVPLASRRVLVLVAPLTPRTAQHRSALHYPYPRGPAAATATATRPSLSLRYATGYSTLLYSTVLQYSVLYIDYDSICSAATYLSRLFSSPLHSATPFFHSCRHRHDMT